MTALREGELQQFPGGMLMGFGKTLIVAGQGLKVCFFVRGVEAPPESALLQLFVDRRVRF